MDATGHIQRFSVLHRLLHIVVMVGFVGLGLTGFSLYFSGAWWARAVAWLLGGAPGLAWLHRALAMMTYAAVMIHLGWLAYYKLVLKGRLTGPEGMFPRLGDLRDLWRHLGWMLGQGAPPAFGRFAYWEKVDYWAVLIGMNTMGLTGVVLWFPEWFASVLPGYFINLALIIHLFEAIIAVALKFVVHVIVGHLRPDIFPMDKSIFHGRMSHQRLRAEHQAHWESLQARAGREGGG